MSNPSMDELLALSEISQLKARYCRYLDQKQWQEWGKLFLPDLHADFSGSLPAADAIFDNSQSWVSFISTRLQSAITIHHVVNPEIEFIDANMAIGIWSLYDRIEHPGRDGDRGFSGFGRYEDVYRKTEDGWRFSSIKLIRLVRTPL